MIVKRIENWYYELLSAWSLWRHREVIGLLRQCHGLPREPGWKVSVNYLWRAF